jgi:peptidyl-Asp metalloendopeptidase
MQQQSIGLQGCTTNTWPLASEKAAVATAQGVAVRSSRPDLYAIKQHGDTSTEVHVVDGAGGYRAFQGQFDSIAAPTAPAAWDFAVADRNRDGVDDVIGIKRWGASGKVEVHVLDGASGYRSWQLHAATVLPRSAGGLWSFDVADTDQDGFLDVVGVNRFGTDARTTVHVLDGAANYSRFLSHAGTPVPHAPVAEWAFATGDHDRDGVPDLYAIKRAGTSGQTEVHVLDGSTGFTQWSTHAVTPVPASDESWDWTVDDYDGDGWDEVYGIKRDGASGSTEVHVLADRTYASFAFSGRLPLPTTDGVPGWRFLAD